VTLVSPDPAAAVKRLKDAYRVLVTCHRNPDGDALGSELGLAELADRLGVETVIVNHDATPANLSYLPGIENVQVAEDLPQQFPEGFDLVLTVECPQLSRSGFEGLSRLPILNIDHHPDNPAYGVVNFLDAEAPAVGEMVWRMFGEAGLIPSPDAATNLFVALSTDTGDFRFSNATGRAFRAAAEMVDAGARPPAVANWIHNNRSLASVRLLGEALRSLKILCGGKLALISADQEAFGRAGAGPEDTEEIVNVPRSVTGVEAVAYFKQWEPGRVRVSLRSRGGVDVREVAQSFGGGGHANAAGCTIDGELDEIESRVAAAVAGALGERL
jgi:bifunctional oligoribonuclease and PAP phosphatase NrnA